MRRQCQVQTAEHLTTMKADFCVNGMSSSSKAVLLERSDAVSRRNVLDARVAVKANRRKGQRVHVPGEAESKLPLAIEALKNIRIGRNHRVRSWVRRTRPPPTLSTYEGGGEAKATALPGAQSSEGPHGRRFQAKEETSSARKARQT